MKFFNEIAIEWEKPGNDDPYMVAWEDPEDVAEVGEKKVVGIYKLDRVVEVTATTNVKVKQR